MVVEFQIRGQEDVRVARMNTPRRKAGQVRFLSNVLCRFEQPGSRVSSRRGYITFEQLRSGGRLSRATALGDPEFQSFPVHVDRSRRVPQAASSRPMRWNSNSPAGSSGKGDIRP